MAEGILTLDPITPERDPDQLGGPGYIEAPLGAGIGLALANMFKKRGIGDNNPPSPIEEEKPPQKEPPKEPNVGEEILTDLATRELDKKLSKEKDPDKKRAIEYLKETNEFYDKKNIKANEERPKLRNENLPKLVDADKHFGAAANSFEDFAESQLIYMSPQEYLDLTKRFRPEKQSKLSKLNSDNIENLLKEGKELANYPYLYVKKDGENFSINGQEGIHRAIAFKNLGYDKIPVVVQGTRNQAWHLLCLLLLVVK